MHTVSVINYKGGVGKTTLTANLGAELAWRGYKVLLIDCDAQASLTFSFIRPEVWERQFAQDRTIKAWFDSILSGGDTQLSELTFQPPRINRSIARNSGGELHLIPSHLGLLNVDLELASQLSGATLTQAKRNYFQAHDRIREAMSEFQEMDFDVTLIDCPPNFNIVTKNAIVASDHLLVPARPDYLSTMGIDYLLRSVRELVSNYNDFAQLEEGNAVHPIDPSILGVVFTMIQVYAGEPTQSQRPYIRQTASLDGINVFSSWVRRHPREFGDAPNYGIPVVIEGQHGEVREELENITTEFIDRVGL